ncbi:MAG: CPBP family glutamic-type intramembrane protease [Acidimicrobiales bacterium]
MTAADQPPGGGGSANPGWYPDPWGRSAWRWWDGWRWSGWISPPESVNPAIMRQIREPPAPQSPAPPEAPFRERLPGGEPAGVSEPLQLRSTYQGPDTGYVQPVTGLQPPTHPITRPARPVERPMRRRLLLELLVVMAVFPLPSTVAALQALVGAVLGEGAGSRLPNLFPGHVGAGFAVLLVEVALPLAGAGLVLYLVTNPAGPDRGMASIGLSRGLVKADLALVLPVFVLAFVIPQYGVSLVLLNAGVKSISPGVGHFPAYYAVAEVLLGLVSAVVEEIVVLGYLVRRLEQLGLPPALVVLLAVAVRGSYHLYYGWGVLPILAWAAVSVVLYRRWRRLAPFIIVHALWDTGVILADWFGSKVLGYELLILALPTLAFFFAWRGLVPRPLASRRPVPGRTG